MSQHSIPESQYTEHYLEEPVLNLQVDKKDIDAYKTNSSITQTIDLKDYKISDAEFVKNFYSDIEYKVLKQSESTLEIKPINFNQVLQQTINNKLEANKLIQQNLDKAIEEYKKVLFEIDDATKSIPDRDFEINKTIKDIMEQKKLILSNLSLCYTKKDMYKESIEIDTFILSMDKNFEKSLFRLINCFTKLGKLENANYYANLAKSKFNSSTLSKYDNILNNLENKNNQADESLKKFSRKAIKRENENKTEIGTERFESNDNNKVSTIGGSFFYQIMKFIFGSVMIVASSGALFFLYKNRHRYEMI